MSNIPTFETKRLILRGVTLEDAPAFQKHFVDYEVIRQLNAKVPWPYPDNDIARYIQEEILSQQGVNDWAWGIFLKEQPAELIGCIHVWRPGSPENRGFWLGRKFWGQGLMTEAVTPVMDYAFDDLGFEKLVFTNAKGNEKSSRIKAKTGARLLRTEPAAFVDPAYKEREIWELTKEEWEKYTQAAPAPRFDKKGMGT